jgi:nucleotide-binding universal stress UspA family protein
MRILLAIDGSEHSLDAARAVQHLAPAEELLVLHVADVPSQFYPMMMPEVALELHQQAEQQLREDGERFLQTVISLLPPKVGRVSKRLELGSSAETILSIAEEERIDLIVLGARGLGQVRELVMGSVSHRVLMHARCSVLLVKTPMRHLQRILLAVSGPDDAEVASRFLSLKPFREAPEIRVLSVLPADQPSWPMGIADAESLKEKALHAARGFAEDVATKLAGQYRTQSAVAFGAPAAAILQEALATRPDLIGTGSRARRGMTRFLLGSVSHAVLHGADCPVLILR